LPNIVLAAIQVVSDIHWSNLQFVEVVEAFSVTIWLIPTPRSLSLLGFVKNLKYDSCYPILFVVVHIRTSPLTLFMTVTKVFSVTRWKDFPPTINEGLFAAVLEEFPATTMLILSEKLQWYSYNHAWGSMNGPLRVHHMKGNFEENASKGRKLVHISMRHDEETLGTLVEALVFLNKFVPCA
ncbi:hypothetical protein KI387_043564, partial [Taxus chinensis]